MKKVISLFLSLVLILSTLSMVDLSAYANENTDEIVGKVDYSNLTQNQYISRILLNYNYLGEANDYNSANEPAEKSELEFWLNPVNVSFARILVNELQANSEFMDSVKGWEVLTFSPGELASDAFKEEDYYTTILLSILDAKVSDNEFIKDINCTTNKTILSITKNTTKFLKELCSIDISDMEDVSIDNLSNTQYNDMLDDMLDTLETSENSKELYDLIGKDIGYISDATKTCKSVSDVIKTVSMYSKLAETSKATQQVLYDIYINCPADNAAMKSAAKKVYEYTSDSLSKEILTLMESGEAVFSFGFDKMINKIWGKVLTAVLGEFGAGLLIGQAVGKSISNFLFSTDAVIDKYYAMNALVKFEDVITKVVTEKGNSYKQNENSSNADNYLRSIELMLATYNLGYDYTKDYLKIVSEKGLINGIKNLFGNNETIDSIQSDIESVKSSVELAYGLVSINTYKFYLEIDSPLLYQAIYGDMSSNIPVSEMNIEQIKELNVGDKGPAYDFFSITYGPENYTETILGEDISSSDESVIAVDNSNCIGGYITVVGSGTCTLTFTTYNGKHSNSVEVTVGELDVTNVFEFGDGSEDNPYQVSTPKQLNAVRNDLSAYYIQICDIDMLNWENWEPIGTDDYPFEGYYDGNDCSIKNLNIKIDKEQNPIENVGLFGISTKILKNINLIDFSCSALNNCIYVGSICGEANKIINCSSSGEIDACCINGGGIAGNAVTVTNCVNYNDCSFYYGAINGFCYYGGICGNADVINKSVNQGTLYTSTGYSSYTGGIVGHATEVSLCYNEAYLEARSTGSTAETQLGGIAGCSSDTNNCYNLGELYANSNYAIIVGGIVSRSFGCTITNCYSFQNISGSTPTYPGRHYGGIIGYSTVNNTYVNNCFYNYSSLCDTTKFQNTASKRLSNEQFLLKSSFDGFDFDNVWKINEKFNNGKPFLLKSPLHNWNEGVVIFPASCNKTGLKLYTCSYCGESFEETIPCIDHSFELKKEVPSTCTSSGSQEYVCINCGEEKTILTNQIDHVFKNYQSDNNATCTKNGTKTAYCEYGCGQTSTIEDENSALGHNYISTERKIEPTCTENGIEYFECSTCGEIYERTPLHNITIDSSLYIESDHNYSNNTNRTYDFNYDGATKLIITFSSDTKVENNYDYIYLYDSNGTEIGKYTGVSLANQSFIITGDSFSIKLTSDSSQIYYGFSFSSIVATVGDETATELLATGHNYKPQVTEPTCITQGYTTYTCLNCGDSYVSDYIKPSHNYDNGICTVCGYYNLIACGNTLDIDIANAGDIIYVYFTPEVDDAYIFYSIGDCDTYVTLYDENMNRLSSDDESGNNNNFSLYYNFESRETYIFECKMWSSSATGSFQVTLEQHEHSYSSEIIEPTCTARGYTRYSCSCGDSFATDYVSSLGHSFVNGVCERCNLVYPELIEVQENEIYNVSFDTSGKSSYYSFTPRNDVDYFIQSNNLLNYVPDCNIRVYDKELNFIESAYFSNEILWYLNNLEEGKIYIIQFSTYSSFENSGNFQFSINQHEHLYSSEIVEPTCTSRGYTRYSCSCGDSFETDYVDALGHNFVDNICINCGVKRIAMDIFLNNTYDIEITEGGQVGYLYFIPEADGSYMFYSTGNYDTYVTLYDENMNGLKSDDDSGKDSNFLISYDFEAGKTYIFACKMWSSSATGSFQVALEQHEHSYSSEIVDPTCTSRGYTRYTCSCGNAFSADYVDALGHNYVDGTCTRCGKIESDFEFELINNETIRITEYTGSDINVVVPSSIGEYFVKEVSYSAFDDCDSIKSITFSEGIERIYCSCSNCPNLEIINIPSTASEFGETPFINESYIETVIGDGDNNEDYIIEGMGGNLKNINVSPENPYYCSIDGILFTKDVDELLRYPSGKGTTIYEIPDTVKTFSSFAFAFCGNIEKLIIPASVETINNQMFVLLKYVKMDGYQSISELKSDFKGFEVSSDNTNYCSVDGVLYTKDMNTLIAYPNGKIDNNFVTDNRVNKIGSMAFTYTLVENVQLNNVKRIEDQAFFQSGFLKSVKISENCNYIGNMGFAYCTKLENIVIPDRTTIADEGVFGCCVNLNKVVLPSSIQKIPQMMFIYCMNLSEIYIPKSVTSVDMSAFATSEKLQTVYYEGTEEEWNKINVEEHNEPLLNATVIFNSNPEMIIENNIDVDTLTAAIEKFNEFDSADYSESSYNNLKDIVNRNKELLDTAQSQEEIDFAVTEILEAIYDLEPYLNFTVSAENGSYEVTCDGGTTSNNKYSLLFGTEITLSATANEGYEFVGWYDLTNNLYFSKESTYTFKLTENTNLKAVFVKEQSATLTFTTYSNWVQSTVTKTIDEWNNITSIEDLLPQVPYKYGYSNGRWVYDNADVLSKLQTGESVFLIPEYDEDDTSLPTPRESEDGVPVLDLYYKLDANANVGSFVMAAGIPDDCQIESVGVAFYYKKANDFDPTNFELLINNKMLVSRFNTEEIEDIYIVNMNKLTSTYNWAVRGYITYYDADGNLKTAYSNQVNIVNREQV